MSSSRSSSYQSVKPELAMCTPPPSISISSHFTKHKSLSEDKQQSQSHYGHGWKRRNKIIRGGNFSNFFEKWSFWNETGFFENTKVLQLIASKLENWKKKISFIILFRKLWLVSFQEIYIFCKPSFSTKNTENFF